MISKSTKKNRRKMAFANENRARLLLHSVDTRVDFWLLGIKKSNCFVEGWTSTGKQTLLSDCVACPASWGQRPISP